MQATLLAIGGLCASVAQALGYVQTAGAIMLSVNLIVIAISVKGVKWTV